ncbi:unannotated protein [freshwater metagenome]|uniref:Unannotated protein n=1 Tax=freshwater metagenome TaxID=449393 RepID=A0A6J6I5E0_9ZZZZ
MLQRLLANSDDRVLTAFGTSGFDGAFGEAQHVGVVAAAHSAVRGDDNERCSVCSGVVAKQRMFLRRACTKQVDDHCCDLVAVGTR